MFANDPSPPQMSQSPGLKSSIAWTVQRSPGYMSNDGTVTVGETTWVIEQQIKSFATFEDQELLLKLKVAIPLEQQEHYFLFHHKQSQKNPVSASAMLTGKFLQIRKVFATSSLLAEEFLDTLQYKISR